MSLLRTLRALRVPGLLLACGLVAGCAAGRPAPEPAPAAAAPVAVEAPELLERLEEPAAPVRSLRGLARLRVDDGDRSATMNQVLLAEYPDRLRTESLSPFGSPLLVLAADGRDLRVLVPGEGRFLSGPATVENLQRFTRLPLRLEDLVGLVLYRPPVFAWREARVAPRAAGGAELVLTGPGASRQSFAFDGQLRLTGAAYYRDGELLLGVNYGGFPAAGRIFPGRAGLVLPPYGLTAELDYGADLELNPALDPGRFVLEPPPGATVEELAGARFR